ncbi:MAG: type II toxin-antitoxin system Phd/YefM family antitoxin [Candidatus Dadabacteria bacterium]|nr:MAG: type II toxin-antitoxin system Phd/YefM family antitoxin [Candidatus Dadabacteria bacterium]
MQASVRTVKNRFSEFLRRAQQGEEIIVTSHNRPVAKLVPLGPEDTQRIPSREDLILELAALRDSLAGALTGEPLSRTVIDLRKKERF